MRHHDFSHDPIERQARRRASAKIGWFIHAAAYVLVNLLLMVLSFSAGSSWALFPLLGWGLGLAVHGAVVFITTGSAGVYDRMLKAERDRLAQEQSHRG